MSYPEYRGLITRLALEGKATGPVQTEALAHYTQLNDKRMSRWDKTLKFTGEVLKEIVGIDQKITWLVLTESWCGDASPALPVMNKMAVCNPNITLKIVLREENNELMEQFLTHGSRSIPKLIMIDQFTREVLGTWGPRSAKASTFVDAYKKVHPTLPEAFKQNLQVWYNNDKGQSILADLMQLLLK